MPAKSPDLNPLAFYIWGEAEAKIQEKGQQQSKNCRMWLKSLQEEYEMRRY